MNPFLSVVLHFDVTKNLLSAILSHCWPQNSYVVIVAAGLLYFFCKPHNQTWEIIVKCIAQEHSNLTILRFERTIMDAITAPQPLLSTLSTICAVI